MDIATRYCINDVEVLFAGIVNYLELFLRASNVDPFKRDCTLAGACLRVFRTNFLKPNVIGTYPPAVLNKTKNPHNELE
jgi:hypothetical protein